MFLYVFSFFISALFCFAPKNKNNKKILNSLILLPIFLLVAFRGYNVGADTYEYTNMFIMMKNGTFNEIPSYHRLELGYRIFLWIITRLFENPQWQYIITAFLFYISFNSFMNRNSNDSPLFVILLLGLNVLNFYFSGVRQCIAMTICLFSYQFAKERNILKFLAIVSIAFLFHRSAIFFLLVYLMSNSKKSNKRIPIYICTFILIVLIHDYIFNLGSQIFVIKYGIEYQSNGYVMVIINAMITILSFLFYNKLITKKSDNSILVELNVVTMCLWILRLFSRTAERPALYFMPFSALLICELIDMIKNKKIKAITKLLVISFMFIYYIYRLDTIGLVPYKFFWE